MDLSRILNELNDFTNIHLKKKNSVINVQEYKNESQRLYASIIKIKGDVTSPYQFYITDSLKNMITASVRYNKSIKYDSVLPSLKYIEKDIYHLIETLTWNSKND
jgi:gliding motility-associated lipoprotein GldD